MTWRITSFSNSAAAQRSSFAWLSQGLVARNAKTSWFYESASHAIGAGS